jgi:hypothetical protein
MNNAASDASYNECVRADTIGFVDACLTNAELVPSLTVRVWCRAAC